MTEPHVFCDDSESPVGEGVLLNVTKRYVGKVFQIPA